MLEEKVVKVEVFDCNAVSSVVVSLRLIASDILCLVIIFTSRLRRASALRSKSFVRKKFGAKFLESFFYTPVYAYTRYSIKYLYVLYIYYELDTNFVRLDGAVASG